MSDSDATAKKAPTCKICCACPAERRARDECVIFNDMEKCTDKINAFYSCLLTEGFSQTQVDELRSKTRKF